MTLEKELFIWKIVQYVVVPLIAAGLIALANFTVDRVRGRLDAAKAEQSRQERALSEARIVNEIRTADTGTKSELGKIREGISTVTIKVEETNRHTVQFMQLIKPAIDELFKGGFLELHSYELIVAELNRTNSMSTLEEGTTSSSVNSVRSQLMQVENALTSAVSAQDSNAEPIRIAYAAIGLATEYIDRNEFVVMSQGDQLTLELPISTLNEDKRIKFVNSLIANPKTIEISKKIKELTRIRKVHESNVDFLNKELMRLTSGWKKLSHDYSKDVLGEVNENMVTYGGNGYSPDFSAEALNAPVMGPNTPATMKVRFNLGNLETSPLIEFSLMIDFNPESWIQKYVIIGAQIPQGATAPFTPRNVVQPAIKEIDYSHNDAKYQLLSEVIVVIAKLDSLVLPIK